MSLQLNDADLDKVIETLEEAVERGEEYGCWCKTGQPRCFHCKAQDALELMQKELVSRHLYL